MELYTEILAKYLSEKLVQLLLPNRIQNSSAIVEGECYCALKEIKKILEDNTKDDSEYFLKIEEIISVFEILGSDTGNRHNF